MSSYMSERSKFSKLMYLSNLDAINKYNLKSQFLVPSLLEISVELPLHRLGDIRTKSQKSFVVSKALNILLILFGSLPQIVYKNSKLSKKKKIYSLRYKLTNKKEIFSFLTLLFSFTSNEKGSSLFNLLKKRDSFINNQKDKKLVLTQPLSFDLFLEIQEFYSEKDWVLDDKLFFDTSFVFNNTISLSKTNKMIQNIYPFWKIRRP